MSAKKEAEVVRLRRVQMGHDISLSKIGVRWRDYKT